MRFPIPLILALVATAAITVIINVSVSVPLSADPRVTYNGTHYLWDSSKGTTNFMISSFTFVSGDASFVYFAYASSYGGSCNTYFYPTVVNWDSMSTGVFYSANLPKGPVRFYKLDANTLLYYCTRVTSTGTTYWDLLPYKVATKVGDVTFFRLAAQTEVDTNWCSSPSPGTYSIANIYSASQWYSCSYKSWGSWGGTWSSAVTPTPGQAMGDYYKFDYTGFSILLGYAWKVNSGTTFIGKPR
ncbi:MAG: hypothetical protein ABWK05_07055 [Pyrobaculum sp.]